MPMREILELWIKAKDDASAVVAKTSRSIDTNLGAAEKRASRFGLALQSGIGSRLDDLARSTPVLGGAMDTLGLSFAGAGAKVALVGGGLGIAAVAAGKAVSAFQDVAQETLKFQRVAGTTAEESSRFVQVFADYGVGADQAGAAVGRFAKTLGTTPQKLTELGVAIARNRDGTVDLAGTLKNVASAFAATDDETRRAAIGQAAFGRTWTNLIPVLEQGADGLAESFANVNENLVLDQEALRTSEQFRLQVDELGDAVQGLAVAAGETLVPALTDVASMATTVVGAMDDLSVSVGDVDQSISLFSGWGDILGFFGGHLRNVGEGLGVVSEKSADASSASVRLSASVGPHGAAGAMAALNDEMAGSPSNAADLRQAFKDSTDAAQDLKDNVSEAFDGIRRLFGEEIEAQELIDDMAEINAEITTMIDTVAKGGDEGVKAFGELDDKIRDGIKTAQEYADNQVAIAKEQKLAEGTTLEAAEASVIWSDAVNAFATYSVPALRAELVKYRDRMMAIPEKRTTEIAQAGMADAQRAADSLDLKYRHIPGTVSTSVEARDRASAVIDRVRRQLQGINGMRSEVFINVSRTGQNILTLAKGGPVQAKQSAVVGERGPELFIPDTAGTIIPHNQIDWSGLTPRWLPGAMGGDGASVTNYYTVNVTTGVGDPVRIGQEIRRYLDASGSWTGR